MFGNERALFIGHKLESQYMKSNTSTSLLSFNLPHQKKSSIKKLSIIALMAVTIFSSTYAHSRPITEGDGNEEPVPTLKKRDPKFWVVNFGTARTLHRKKIGFAAGMGGQIVSLGDPQKKSAFFTIPHAGFRYGLTDRMDAGLRLAPIPLPFSSVGPGFGVNLDVKYCFTNPEDKVQFALVLGAGGAHVLIEEKTRWAYSPNGAALTSFKLNERTDFTVMGRYVNLAIPTAVGGKDENYVNIAGTSFGLKKSINSAISIFPEVGVYWYDGRIGNVRKSGPGFQYGVMLATSF
jgi:hypothetical protein